MAGSFVDFRSQVFSFLLLPEFSLMALTAVIEPLRHANAILGYENYVWKFYSWSGSRLTSSSQVEIAPCGGQKDIAEHSNIVLCSGPDIAMHSTEALRKWLRRAARYSPMIGALCTAPRILAEAGILDGYRATIHWESLQSFRESFPRVNVCDGLFELDRDRMTCAGETAGIDMMTTLLAVRHGFDLAAQVAARILCSRVRAPREPQTPIRLRLGSRCPHLIRVIEIMEANIEDPLELDFIVDQINCSRRQIERSFNKHLSCSPIQYYRNLRLDRARQLLADTQMGYTEVGIACGFSSATSFSRAYRQRFGVSPYNERGIPKLAVQYGERPIPFIGSSGAEHQID
jgi:transcriptional regulator GlxA family with amidase domain